MRPLPVLKEYRISSDHGFLDDRLPLARLSSNKYMKWEEIVAKLPSLLQEGSKVRTVIDELEVLDLDDSILGEVRELRRAYSILGFMAHAYIWASGTPQDVLPECIARPLLETANILGLPPLATYSSLVLWNFKMADECKKTEAGCLDLENITTINTFTGTVDESWFYLVSVRFEKIGSACLNHGLEVLSAIRNGDKEDAAVVNGLEKLAATIERLSKALMEMEVKCDPNVFYFKIRPFLAGWTNMSHMGLPQGVKYGTEGKYQIFSGGSNAQSSLIQTLDILLGVKHTANAAHSSKGKSKVNYLDEMKKYMPREHREFLYHLASVCNIREYVSLNPSNRPLQEAYGHCISKLKTFRDNHIQIVTKYIILPSNSKQCASNKSGVLSPIEPNTKAINCSGAKVASAKTIGTGGTRLMPFLKQCRDETIATVETKNENKN
ncbi:hypothetical protein SMKI_10G2720 [Saccharomyces mikatae IFO 1815]|uniref:Indoleamine 2,3-dioxygenase n=1 Tax=Saccharomyces mikatae IFO 1815 TaxID=226126 RepID=A0AA35IQU6_SACMI|nr:uncharacterized protein SMKI_10G2720 [Saccharomyces mikatae IFO 1815]CAI4034479.1 hypothetical protein SMKI_10G2720 [Saccharomyces mikatae IFO 1815]